MTVVFKKVNREFAAGDVLWARPELINAIVEHMLINQTEAFIDMIIDDQGREPISRASVNETLRGVKDSAMDFWNDVVHDLETAVQQRLKEVNYGAAVTGLKFDLAGDVTDIEVDVSVSVD